MEFSPNLKSIEYIDAILDDKLLNTKKTRDCKYKIYKTTVELELFGSFVLEQKKYSFDRNIIMKLNILSNFITTLKTNHGEKQRMSENLVRIYEELIDLVEQIEIKYCLFTNTDIREVFLFRSGKLFRSFLNDKEKNKKVAHLYFDLAKEYINELEYMSYVLINHLDNLHFDLKSYTQEYLEEFLSIS